MNPSWILSIEEERLVLAQIAIIDRQDMERDFLKK
jgi:hypothetical protein